MTDTHHPYTSLTQDTVMDAVESLGVVCDGCIYPMNSYENRVYRVGQEDAPALVAKFYRPQRWSEQAIREEHAFLLELEHAELPVVAPLAFAGETLHHTSEFMFALFPMRQGHAPEFSADNDLEWMGRWLARLHLVGEQTPFTHRPNIWHTDATHDNPILRARETVLQSALLPSELANNYADLMSDLAPLVQQQWQAQPLHTLRLHGDCHSGNVLMRDGQLHLVDFDDCRQGPSMQDIWMLLSGSDDEQRHQLDCIARGYEVFRPFPDHERRLIEPLRTLRITQYAAWLCSRWSDPAFPLAFPWLADIRFWSEHILSLREQTAALQHSPSY